MLRINLERFFFRKREGGWSGKFLKRGVLRGSRALDNQTQKDPTPGGEKREIYSRGLFILGKGLV